VQEEIPAWQGLGDGAPYVLAAQSALLPSAIIYDSGLEALPIGGFDGTTPSPTLAQLQADIQHGLFHLVWISSATDPRLRWLTTHCSAKLTQRLYFCGGTLPAVAPGGPVPVSGPSPSAAPAN
jgi:hypothetical protein